MNHRQNHNIAASLGCRRESGFTLIELMIAVSIIGILSALAIANYSTYTARARQGEAKLGLSSIFSLEKSFHTEYGAFIDDFSAIGFMPEGIKRHYSVGWRTQTSADAVAGYEGGIDIFFFDYVNVPLGWGGICSIVAARAGLNAARSGTGINPQTFEVKARGVLRNGIDCDEWQIDNNKQLANTIINL